MVIGAVSAGCSALGFTGPRWFRAAMFGCAGAVLFALSAALTKQFTDLLAERWVHVFTDWVPYVLVATGVIGLFLIQSSFHAGPITSSQAAITIVDPIVSVVIGIYLFHDRLQTAGWRLPVEVVAIVLVVAGLLLLSTSPLVAGAKDESGKGDKLVRQPRQGLAPVRGRLGAAQLPSARPRRGRGGGTGEPRRARAERAGPAGWPAPCRSPSPSRGPP